jgi:tetratricopeptide (TPR) repeat protein
MEKLECNTYKQNYFAAGLTFRIRNCEGFMADMLQLARHQLAEGRADLAIAQLRVLAEQNPYNSVVWRLLGIACHEEQLEPEAVTALTNAMALDGNDIGTATMLAQSSFLAGLPAVAHFERLLALAPKDPNGLRGYAAALATEGEPLAAEQLLRDALNEQPNWLATSCWRVCATPPEIASSSPTLTVLPVPRNLTTFRCVWSGSARWRRSKTGKPPARFWTMAFHCWARSPSCCWRACLSPANPAKIHRPHNSFRKQPRWMMLCAIWR